MLANLQAVQSANLLPQSDKLEGRYNLTIEMETGTGKTYTYIKTMYELNRAYGWTKFIVVVPSIAIREGVAKSFSMLEDHFMEHYGKKARWFVYNSSNLQQLDQFSQDSGISVMIINTQAFAASMKEGAKNKESRILTGSTGVMNNVLFPTGWENRWREYWRDMTRYQRIGKNAHDDAQDATTGVYENLPKKEKSNYTPIFM